MCFRVKFAEYLRTPFTYRTPPVAASVLAHLLEKSLLKQAIVRSIVSAISLHRENKADKYACINHFFNHSSKVSKCKENHTKGTRVCQIVKSGNATEF